MADDNRQIDRIEGTGIPVRGNNIDTDRIIPARYLKAVTFDGLGEHVFEDDRQAMPDHPFSNPRYRRATILLANENFGSGSSREHAPQALKRWGITVCVGESFSEIFRGNAVAIGVPCATAEHINVEYLMRCVEEAPDIHMVVSVSDRTLQIRDRTITLVIPDPVREALLNGHWDPSALLLDRFSQVRAVAQGLPYIKGFSD